MDESQPKGENEPHKRARDFLLAGLETMALFAGLYVVSRATAISFDSAGFAILFLCSGIALLVLTLLILRTRR